MGGRNLCAKRWFGLAVGSLILAGLFAGILVVGRAPGLDVLFSDPLVFRRLLVVHVDLSMVMWFYSFLGALFLLVPSRAPISALSRTGPFLGLGGIALLIAAAGISGSEPVLSNYVPVIDHPLFVAGLVVFALGLGVTFLSRSLWDLRIGDGSADAVVTPAAAMGLRAAAIAFLLALPTFAAAAVSTPQSLDARPYYELVMWGGGHVLQFASVAAMIAVWLMLVTPLAGAPLSRRASAMLFGILLLPLLPAPWFAAGDTTSGRYIETFTHLMELGVFPIALIFLFACVRALVRAKRAGRMNGVGLSDPRLSGFVASAVLTASGFILGALITGSNTMVPGHYHASIGAVTASFMGVSYSLLEPLGFRLTSRRARRMAGWQPLLFGFGQLVFACGFSIAGFFGMARKTYAVQQQIHHPGQTVGLVVMSIGGLIAVAGGLLFLGLMVTAWRGRVGTRRAREIAANKEFDNDGRTRVCT